MRFLLYPRTPTAVARRVVEKSTTKKVPPSSSSAAPQRWGQQCSPECGCVVRFEARNNSNNNSNSSKLQLSYTAKQVVSVPMSTSNNNNSPHHQRQAVLTSKGRPMLQKCSCNSVHHLSSCLVEYYNNNKNNNNTQKDQMRSDLEFQSVRSSRAFQQSVLRTQGLPVQATHCFDVVEEAWTAMVKGHMPSARNSSAVMEDEDLWYNATTAAAAATTTTTASYHHHNNNEPSRSSSSSVFAFGTPLHDLHDDDHHDDYPEEVKSSWSLSSTLRMFDLNQQEEDAAALEEEANRVQDWQAYVDQLYMEQQTKEEEKSA